MTKMLIFGSVMLQCGRLDALAIPHLLTESDEGTKNIVNRESSLQFEIKVILPFPLGVVL